jgi:hypothetical protein
MKHLHAESVLECGGKRSATPLSNRLPSSNFPALKKSSTRTRDKERGRTRWVHGTDARPILEVEALPMPTSLSAQSAW